MGGRIPYPERAVTPELIEECADWIAAQLEEESKFVDAGLIQVMLEHEWADDLRIPAVTHDQAADRIIARLADAGVHDRVVGDSIDRRLVLDVLSWEDEFLALAGRSRTR
jgi:hypothetical protein